MPTRRRPTLVAALALPLILAAVGGWTLLGEDRVWTGGDDDWENPDAWDPAGIPGDPDATDAATIESGAVTLGTAYTIADLALGEATLDASEDLTMSAGLDLAGGTLAGTGDFTAADVVLDGGTITEGANVCCTVVADQTLEIWAATAVGRGLVNRGAGSWTAGDLDLTAGGRLVNEAGATFTVESADTDLVIDGGQAENAGTWIHGADSCCDIVFETDFTNTGTVDLRGSVSELNDCCTFRQTDGLTEVAGDAVLAVAGAASFEGGDLAGAGELAVTGGAVSAGEGVGIDAGRVAVSGGGSVDLATGEPASFGELELADGTFAADHDVGVDRARLTGGLMEADSCCNIVIHEGLEIDAAGAEDVVSVAGALEHRGEGSWTAGALDLTAAGAFRNAAGATFTVESADTDLVIDGGETENAGTWIHGADACCNIIFETDFTNTGTVDLRGSVMEAKICCEFRQTDGLTRVASDATLVAAAGLDLDGGVLEGAGTVEGAVTNGGGTVAPGTSVGVLALEGDYAQAADGALEIEVAGPEPGTGHDRLEVSGAATLDGTLRVVRDGAFEPDLGAELAVMTWEGRDGEFAAVDADPAGDARAFEPRYDADGLVLAVVATTGPALAAEAGGAAPPGSSSAAPGDAGVPVLQAALAADAGADHGLIEAVTLEASGTGNDAADLERVTLVADEDGDGAAGEGEPVLATGAYGSDDGSVELALDAPLRLAAGEEVVLLVTYDVASALAAAPLDRTLPAGAPMFLLGLAGLALVGRRRRRRAAGLALLAAVALAPACGDDDGGITGPEPSYAVEMTAMSATGETSGEPATVTGLPVAGTELAVSR